MLDEQADFFGTGTTYVLTTLQNIEMTCRKNQINLIYCAPCVRTHYHNYVLETFMCKWPEQRRTVTEKGYIPFGKTFSFVYGQQSKNYLDPQGYIVTNHPKNLEALIRYEKKKDTYNKRVQGGDAINIKAIKERIISEYRNSKYAPSCETKKDIRMAIKLLGILPDGAPNTLLEDISHQIWMENRLGFYESEEEGYYKKEKVRQLRR